MQCKLLEAELDIERMKKKFKNENDKFEFNVVKLNLLNIIDKLKMQIDKEKAKFKKLYDRFVANRSGIEARWCLQYPFTNSSIHLILAERCRLNLLIRIHLNESDYCQQDVLESQLRNMQLYKQKIAAAKKGHELLKRKADALKKKFKEIMKLLLESKKRMG